MKLPLEVFTLIDKVSDKGQNKKISLEYCQYADVYKDIKYSYFCDECFLDMYKPINQLEKYPVLIYIHGGGYVAGNKYHRRAIGYYFAAKCNAIVLNLEYKKSPDNTYLESIKELSSIFKYVVDNKEKYRFDLENITLMGDSSGACCALSLTALAFHKEYQNIVGTNIELLPTKCILDCGFYSFDISNFDKKIFSKVVNAITKDNPTDEALYKCNSLNYLNSNLCPILFCHAKYDVLCKNQGYKLKEKLDQYQIPYKEILSTSRKDNHCYPLFWKSKKAKEFNELSVEFVKNTNIIK